MAEWQFEAGGWLQVHENKQLAGRSSVTFVETILIIASSKIEPKSVMRGEQVSVVICLGARRPISESALSPKVDGKQARLIGEVNDHAKQGFLAGAAALLFPIDWPEPFGLVMIEAIACGTPVIAFRSGSVPEVVDHGVTGFVVSDEEEAIQAIKRIGELDRRRIRAQFEKRFTARRMAEEYLKQYAILAPGLNNVKRQEPGGIDLPAQS